VINICIPRPEIISLLYTKSIPAKSTQQINWFKTRS